MAKQVQKGSILAKFNSRLRGAFESRKGDETEFSNFGELPPSIENGIAKLVLCKIDLYKEGDFKDEPYFMAQGVVLSPSQAMSYDVTGEPTGMVPVAGLRTQIGPEPLCDTPDRQGDKARRTADDHMGWVLNELRKLGLDTDGLDYSDLEGALSELEAMGVTFRFRTWRGKATEKYPNPRTFHMWNGHVEYNPEESDDGVDDQSGPSAPTRPAPQNGPTKGAVQQRNGATKGAPSSPSAPSTSSPKAPTQAPAKGGKGQKTAPPASAPAPATSSGEDSFDLDELVEIASGADQLQALEAQNRLKEVCDSLGITDEEYDNAPSWQALGELIQERQAGEEGGEAEEGGTNDTGPQVGDVVKYRPVDPKTNKAGKLDEYEVVSIDLKSQTARLKNTTTGIQLKALAPLDKLILD